jgi:hypothetical protein
MSRLMTGTARERCGTDRKHNSDGSNSCAEAGVHVKLLLSVRETNVAKMPAGFQVQHPFVKVGSPAEGASVLA